jgi:hypothetical protein
MMHESEFKEIILLYKQLRKEGVIFPARDPSEKFMIQFKGTQSPIFQTIEENKLYEEPNKQFSKKHDKKSTKDFISDSYGNNPITSAQPKVNYMGQNYEAQRRAEQQEIEEEVEECDYIDDDEVTIVRESCILLDDIMTHAQHLNELRSEISMEVVEAHEVSLKKLKKLFLGGQAQQGDPERNVITN